MSRPVVHREVVWSGIVGACWFCAAPLIAGVRRYPLHGGYEEPFSTCRRVVIERLARNDNAAVRRRRRFKVDACMSCSSRKGRRDVDWLRRRMGGDELVFPGERAPWRVHEAIRLPERLTIA